MVDWNSQEEVEKFSEKSSWKRFELYKKFKEASESGDTIAAGKARLAFRKHSSQESKHKEKAEKEGYCW